MPRKKVEIIKPQEQKKKSNKKYNVCAYARVSTGAEEQKDSFVNQQKFYEDKIKSNPDYNLRMKQSAEQLTRDLISNE